LRFVNVKIGRKSVVLVLKFGRKSVNILPKFGRKNVIEVCCVRRYAMTKLLQWKDKVNRKPLIIEGARQVGKTWLMREFGKKQFANTAYINFFNNRAMANAFEADFELQSLLMKIGIESKCEVTAGDTLIIFDEIQECPRALEALKFFCEEAPEYHIVAAGSLLGIAIHEGISFPVGKVETMKLRPMNFCEFLEAMGEDGLAKILLDKRLDITNDFHERLNFWLRNYYYVGGMPEVVGLFSGSKDYEAVRKIQNDILKEYENDFGKHIGNGRLARTRLVWNSIPGQLAKENKKFFFGQIKHGARAKDFEESIQWLVDCGLVHKVSRVTKPAVPLKAYAQFDAYKLFMADVGLLAALSELDAHSILEGNRIYTEFKGALAEQFVLQELVATDRYIPYYYASESAKYEIDFLVQIDSNVVPIEVKSGENLMAKSLKAYHEKFMPQTAIRTSMTKYKSEDWLINLPLYAICTI